MEGAFELHTKGICKVYCADLCGVVWWGLVRCSAERHGVLPCGVQCGELLCRVLWCIALHCCGVACVLYCMAEAAKP